MAENVFQEIEQTNLDLLMNAASWLREPARHPGNPPAYPCRAHAVGRPVPAVAADPGPVGRGRDADHRHGDHRLHRPASIMKTHHKTYILIGLFFIGLLVLLGLEYAGVPTEKERRLRESLVLPELIDVPEESIRKLAIERGDERLVFERRGQRRGRWQMVEPYGRGGRADAAGDPGAKPQGAAAIARLGRHRRRRRYRSAWLLRSRRSDSGPTKVPARRRPIRPVATLALGKTMRGMRYVRPGGTDAIEVADARF